MEFKDRAVLVTGGANGIGRGIVQCFAEQGARIVIADWSEEDGQAACDELARDGVEALYVKMDVRREEEIEQVVTKSVERFGRIDVLVNDIGTHYYRTIEETTAEQFDRVLQTDLRGHFLMSQKVIPVMEEQGKGSIVNISSIHAVSTRVRCAAYAAAKGGINAMTRAMALECAPKKIRINTVMPGMSISKAFQQRLDALTPEERDRRLKEAAYNTPIGHVGDPMEIGYAVCFLASDKASFITGAALAVDGGESIHLDWQ